MGKKVGRPQKYAILLWALRDEELYTPATIAARAQELALLEPAPSDEQRKLPLLRIRITMGRLSNNHGFPDEGDGFVVIFGQAPTAGWYGWRWKASAQPLTEREYERLAAAVAHLPEREALLRAVERK